MNQFAAQAVFDGTSWLGMYRLCHQTRHRTVLDARRQAIRYPTPEQAKIAAHEALLAELNGKPSYWRGGDTVSKREAGEAEWKRVTAHGESGTKAKAGRGAVS